jgi:hypothetical protein
LSSKVTTTRQVHTRYNGGSWQPASHFSERDAWVCALTSSRGGRTETDSRTQPSPSSGTDRASAPAGNHAAASRPIWDAAMHGEAADLFFFFARSVPLPPQPSAPSGRCSPDATPVAVAVGALRCAAVNASIGWPVAKPGLLRARYFCYHYRFVRFIHACGLVEAGQAQRCDPATAMGNCLLAYSYTTMAEQSRQKPRGQIQKWGYIKSFMHHA